MEKRRRKRKRDQATLDKRVELGEQKQELHKLELKYKKLEAKKKLKQEMIESGFKPRFIPRRKSICRFA